jgi:DNA-binding CsgD family transcriptional regulator
MGPVKLDVIRAIEASYASAPDDEAWLGAILDALAPLDRGGMFAQVYSLGPEGRRVEASVQTASLGAGSLDRTERCFTTFGRPPEMWAAMEPVDWARRRARLIGPDACAEVTRFLASEHVEDCLGIFAVEPDGRILLVSAVVRGGTRRHPSQTVHQLRYVAAHLGASMRLRRALLRPDPDAVLDAGGKVLDAVGPGATKEARRSLSDAVRRMDRARGRLRRTDPDEALQLWEGLVDGSWSLVDRCDHDGKRYVLARRNEPHVPDPKALTDRERAVLAFAAMGHQNKFIGYLLGLSPSRIAAHLASAQRKLGLHSRAEMIREFAALVQRPDASARTSSPPQPST